jgi:hypothetical protein
VLCVFVWVTRGLQGDDKGITRGFDQGGMTGGLQGDLTGRMTRGFDNSRGFDSSTVWGRDDRVGDGVVWCCVWEMRWFGVGVVCVVCTGHKWMTRGWMTRPFDKGIRAVEGWFGVVCFDGSRGNKGFRAVWEGWLGVVCVVCGCQGDSTVEGEQGVPRCGRCVRGG